MERVDGRSDAREEHREAVPRDQLAAVNAHGGCERGKAQAQLVARILGLAFDVLFNDAPHDRGDRRDLRGLIRKRGVAQKTQDAAPAEKLMRIA